VQSSRNKRNINLELLKKIRFFKEHAAAADSQYFKAAINMVVQNIQKLKEQLHICDLIQQ